MLNERIRRKDLLSKVMTADEAAKMIKPNIGEWSSLNNLSSFFEVFINHMKMNF